MINAIIISAIFVLGFINRAFHLFRHPWVRKDTFSHLWIAREIRKSQKFPKEIWGYPYARPNNFPPFPNIILALWPEKYHKKLQYIGPCMDLIIGLIILAGCLPAFGLNVSIIALSLYFFTPMSRDNYISLGSRAFGSTFMICTLFSLFIFYSTTWPPVLVIASIFASLVFLTHRTTLQSMVVVLIAIAIGLRSFSPLLVLVTGFLFAVLFTKGFYLKILKGHLHFVAVTAKKVFKPGTRGELTAIYPNPILYFFNVPMLVLIPFYFLPQGNLTMDFFWLWGFSLLGLSVLWIFGDGYHHLSSGIIPFAVLTAVWLVNSGAYWILSGLLVVCMGFTTIKIWRLEKENSNFVSDDLLSAFKWLKEKNKSDDMVLCFPFDIFQALYYFNSCKIQRSGVVEGALFNKSVINKTVKEGKIAELVREYNVKWILSISKTALPGEVVYSCGDARIHRV